MVSWRAVRTVAACAVVIVPALLAQNPQKAKLPKPKQLDADVTWRRDTSTGEMDAGAAAGSPAEPALAGSPHAISVSTEIVPVTCSVTDALGAAVRGLTREDFQIYD